MRDPLHWLDVKRKLALTFVGVCLLAFGVGGSLAATSASTALEEEILLRLRYQCRAWAGSLDGDLRLMTRRVEDFASDGYIREGAATAMAAAAAPGPDGERVRANLRRHLAVNKLPLVEAFADLAVLDDSGGVIVTATGAEPAHIARIAAEVRASVAGPWHSGLLDPGTPGGPVLQAIAVPLYSLDGTRRIGRLVAWVVTDRWLAGALGTARGEPDATAAATDDAAARRGETIELAVADASGLEITPSLPQTARSAGAPAEAVVVHAVAEPSADTRTVVRGATSVRVPLETNGWTVRVRLHSPEALAPVAGLQVRFLLVGVALALVIGAILLFPMRYLARPLIELREAAKRLEAGDLTVRVVPNTEDEIGDLSRSFNHMADSVETRTRRLEEAARELAAQRDRLDTVISSMRDGLVVLDERGRAVLSNTAAKPLVALVEARDARLISHAPCDEAKGAAGSCAACLFDVRRPLRACVVDAGGRSYEVSTTPLPPQSDGHRGRVLVARDITDRVAQDEHEMHQERLSVLGEVAAVMAHELNNPLAAISMFTQMTEQGLGADSPFREHLEVVRRNTETCKRTIRELLDYATGSPAQLADVDVHDVLRDVARFLRPVAERAGARIALELRAEQSEIAGDEIQVRQVFVNLVVNAIQAMGKPGGVVTITTTDADGHLVADVTDAGPGIAPEARSRIFDAFFTTKGRGVGTGLGLPTARRIAELHGGGLDLVASEQGRTVFRVRLRTRAPIGSAA
ncbi:MAG: HAMP domain-containing protein [Planctomycetes bacterium]|nr:HAMP domain-containing protein [Planctomycetota bacterium]